MAGIFVSLALIFSYVESLIPFNFGIPGIKLGLANVVVVTGLYLMKLPDVCLISHQNICVRAAVWQYDVSYIQFIRRHIKFDRNASSEKN